MIYDELERISEIEETIEVGISNEIVTLLSQQLYQSPLKAIEELVVNSYDADAPRCHLYVPDPATLRAAGGFLAIYDDGLGLSAAGMKDLWHVGRSDKRSEEIARVRKRKQIGKFGIGKLAVFVISNRLTYVSASAGKIHFSTLDFRQFASDVNGTAVPVKVELRVLENTDEIASSNWFGQLKANAGFTNEYLQKPSWTLAILEEFKEKASDIRFGRLRWVLRTAMPLKAGFELLLNNEEIKSSKEDVAVVASFAVFALDAARIDNLNAITQDNWKVSGNHLVSDSFPNGVTGTVEVMERTLQGKSDDILRSNGFFVRVRGRLIAQEDPLFGMNPTHHGVSNRLRAEIEADDLDNILKAPPRRG